MTRMRAVSTRCRVAIKIGDILAGGNDDPAARHHRVVLALERKLLAVRAMISCHERHAGALARQPCRPGRRARPRMHQRYFPVTDQPFQRRRVAPDAKRVLGLQRQGDVPAAGALDQPAIGPPALATSALAPASAEPGSSPRCPVPPRRSQATEAPATQPVESENAIAAGRYSRLSPHHKRSRA